MLHLAKATTATPDRSLEPLKPEHALPQFVCRRWSSQALDGSCKNADRDALLALRSDSAPSTSTLLITWRRLAEEAASVALLDEVVYLPPSESATSHSGSEFVRTALPDPASCIQSALGAPVHFETALFARGPSSKLTPSVGLQGLANTVDFSDAEQHAAKGRKSFMLKARDSSSNWNMHTALPRLKQCDPSEVTRTALLSLALPDISESGAGIRHELLKSHLQGLWYHAYEKKEMLKARGCAGRRVPAAFRLWDALQLLHHISKGVITCRICETPRPVRGFQIITLSTQ